MKRVLIVIYDMRIGGAQRSLLSFLQTFQKSEEREDYDISLLAFNPTGAFMAQIPQEVHVLEPDPVLRWVGARMNGSLLRHSFSLRGLLGKAVWCMKKLVHAQQPENVHQAMWKIWKRLVPSCTQPYDVAISYIDGMASYYVMDKVEAKKKVLWIHNDYHKLRYDAEYDRAYYGACDAVITVSDECGEAFCSALPEYREKTHVLENISSADILKRSGEGSCPEYEDCEGLRLLTVGRLHIQKGIDLAVETADYLRKRAVPFTWLVVGEGSEREALETKIREMGLNGYIRLIGSRDNPYKYMSACDILVQTSRYEGKSIVLDEAKMLCKPIVVTRYSTVNDSIEDGVTGVIAEMHAESVGEGILRMANDPLLRSSIEAHLRQAQKGNEQELRRYIDIML